MVAQIALQAAWCHAWVAGHAPVDASLDAIVVLCLAWQGRRRLQRTDGRFSISTGCIILAGIFFSFDGMLKVMPIPSRLAAVTSIFIS